MLSRSPLIVALVLSCLSPFAPADDFDAVRTKLEAAMQAADRPQADVARDENRMPIETLEFFGLRDDMRVVELIPGGGWYTRLLAPVLREDGQLYIAYMIGEADRELISRRPFDRVQVLAEDVDIQRDPETRLRYMDDADLGVSDVDMVLTFRNYHNFNDTGRAAINRAVFDALKPGGIYGVIDHTRRHMQPDYYENRRRVDPVEAIKQIQSVGFELVDYSGLHYRADDELRYEVGRHTVTGNTDRFSLKFRKPLD